MFDDHPLCFFSLKETCLFFLGTQIITLFFFLMSKSFTKLCLISGYSRVKFSGYEVWFHVFLFYKSCLEL
jgi:hypothetical protein